MSMGPFDRIGLKSEKDLLWFGRWMSCTVWNSVFEPSPPNPVFVLVSDTTRADAFQKADTPNLDRLANAHQGQAVQFAIAPSSWTSPSVLSMFLVRVSVNMDGIIRSHKK